MKRSGLYNQLLQFLNWVFYEGVEQKKTPVHRYEPLHLHVYEPVQRGRAGRFWHGRRAIETETVNIEPPKHLDLESFQFILKQVPTIKTMEFSGWGDPFDNPHLIDIINTAWKQQKIKTTVHTYGTFEKSIYKQLLTSHLDRLVFSLPAHKPSAFGAVTGLNASRFVDMENSLRQFLLVREHYPQQRIFIELAMVVDVTSVYQIPDMIAYAEQLGVDGIRFENLVSPRPGEKSLQTLYANYKKVNAFLSKLNEHDYRIQVTLPTSLEPDMSSERNCSDPHTTVSVTGDLRVSPCSRHQVLEELTANVWDVDFWNNPNYQWLRAVHGDSESGSETREDVPSPCQDCTHNISLPPTIFNDRTKPADPPEKPRKVPIQRPAMW